jgi:glycosyltransferase involved in cell wall biosynthesis
MSRARVTFIVNGGDDSPASERARALAKRIAEHFDVNLVHRCSRGAEGAFRFAAALRRARPRAVYVVDMGAAGVLAAAWHRLASHRARIVIDTGDAIYELVRSSGMRGRVGQWLTWLLERCGLAIAHHLVARGTYHKELLVERGHDPSRITIVPDGVDVAQFAADRNGCCASLRDSLGLNGQLVVGLVGSTIWSERLGMCYGWELVEAMRWLKHEPVKGLLVGDGSGIEHLRRRCTELGVEDRVLFVGRVPYERLPEYLGVMDVCLSTQTNDIPGRVRTTGKLPLYLAAGRHVLASKVGEAARLLPAQMLLDYSGTRDDSYPRRLADRIRQLLVSRVNPSPAPVAQAIARQHFDYDVLAPRVADLLNRLIQE